MEETEYIRSFNAFLGFIHAASLFGIASYGHIYLRGKATSIFVVDIAPWFSLKDVDGCSPNNFARDTRNDSVIIGAYTANVFDFCVAFAAISASYHFTIVALTYVKSQDSNLAVSIIRAWVNPLRWIDYGLSTPLMGVVLYAAYGINSFYALWLQAIGFTGLQAFGALIEFVNLQIVKVKFDRRQEDTLKILTVVQGGIMVVAFAILGLLFTPLFMNMDLIRDADRANQTRINASPPKSVTWFTVVILAFYSSFGLCAAYSIYEARIVSASNETRALYRIDQVYGACSAMAKTVLHWGLAFVILGQDNMITETDLKDPRIRCDSAIDRTFPDYGYLIIITAGAILFGLLTLTIDTPVTAGNNRQKQQEQYALTSFNTNLDTALL